MAKYIAYLEQAGEGCDYTIACGKLLIELESDDLHGALEEIKQMLKEEYHGERALGRLRLFKIEEELPVDLRAIYRHFEEEKNKAKAEAKRLKDYNEYQRLKKQFDNNE